jgi:uncharacterized membrane protein YbhN (UPF0104 family)
MPRHLRPILSFAVKAAISALLLYLSLRLVDLASVRERLARVDIAWLGVVLLVTAVQIAVLALRWRLLALVADAPVSAATALRYGFIAAFFSQTLPSTVGGDAARILLLGRHAGSFTNATYSVLIDRVVGLFALAVIVIAFLPLTFSLIGDPAARLVIAAMGAGGFFGPLVFAAIPLIRGRWPQQWWATRHLRAAARVTWRLWTSARLACVTAISSLLVHALTIVSIWAAARSIGAPLGVLAAFSIVPPVILISTIPVSIGGWGVRESAMIAAFGYAGLSHGDGLMVSLIFGAASFAAGAAGGLIWIASGERAASAAERAALQERR